MASKGARDVGCMKSGERRKRVPVLCTNSAPGSYIPPMFIFTRKRMADHLMTNAPSGSISVCTDTGWTDDITFMKWIKQFIMTTKQSPHEKHLIILEVTIPIRFRHMDAGSQGTENHFLYCQHLRHYLQQDSNNQKAANGFRVCGL